MTTVAPPRLDRSRLSAFYARLVRGAAGWLTPRRVKTYPAVLILGAAVFLLWGEWVALRSGLPFAQTLGQDFAAFYAGGRFFLDGRLAQLYDFSAQRTFLADQVAPGMKALFVNPPFTVLLFALFAWDGYEAGLLLWWGLGLLALAFSIYLLRGELLSTASPSVARLLWASFLFYPTLAWFIYAQNAPLTLLIYVLIFVMLRRGRDFAAGLALGLLLFKPQLAVALGVMLLVKRRWRALAGGALSAGVWAGVGYALSPAATRAFLRLAPALPELERARSHTWGLNSFFGFAALLLDGVWRAGADLLAAGLTLAGLLVVAAWWRRTAWQPGARAWDLTLAATLTLGLLISPHLFLYDLMLLLLPLAIVWSYYAQGTNDRALDGGPLLAWTAALYVVTFVGSYFSAAQQQLSLALGLPPIALQLSVPVIAAWAWLVRRLAHAPTAAPSPS